MTDEPTRQAIAARDRSVPGKVTGRLKHCLELMVWGGLTRDLAAKEAGLKPHSVYVAFRKSHVKAHYLSELGALRDSERSKTFHRLCELRDQDDNRAAAVSAAKALEQLSEDQTAGQRANVQLPGLIIEIKNEIQPSPVVDAADRRLVDVTPRQIEHELVEPPAKHHTDLITVDEIEGRSSPPPPPPEPPAPPPAPYYDEQEELERMLEGRRLAPASMQAAPKVRGEIGFVEPQPRGARSPLAR
jgi:hypothetical protein